jgi:exonuclease SbcC
MRDSRYTFHRSSRAPQARVRSGLDIEVLDDWTGEARPPSTLSGGETFKLSLALALGLADVITHESGGLDVETLFIDEGFGMLDPETLDEVMDCIDDLRSGGRAVGVVSHVTELRARISAQLQVTPTRRGSSISLATSLV